MQDVVITLVFMMALLAFAIFPAVKIVDYIGRKKTFSHRLQNYLTLLFTIMIAFSAALFMKLA